MSTIVTDTITGKSTATTITIGSTPVVSASANSMTIRGEGSNQTSIQSGLVKGWYNLDGTGTIGMNDSFNMTSTTDHGTGEYTCSFTNNMGNATYAYGMGEVSNTAGNAGQRHGSNGVATGTFRTRLKDAINSSIDLDPLCVLICGDLA